MLYPEDDGSYGKPPKMSYCDAMNELLISKSNRFTDDDYIKTFRLRIIAKMTTPKFIRILRWLYSLFSDEAAHKMAAFAPTLPSYDKFKEIKETLSCVGICKDEPHVLVVQLLLEPFPMPNRQTSLTTDTQPAVNG